MRPKIDERCNGFAIREQRLSVKVRKLLIRDTEVVRPDEPTVFLDAPAIAYVPADQLLAERGATQHEPLEGKQLGSGINVDFRLPAKASPIEDDRLLGEPREFRGLARFQRCRDPRRLVQSAIDLLGRLRSHRDGSIRSCRHVELQPISARNTTRRIYENSLFDRSAGGSWEHDAEGSPLKDVHDPGARFRAAQYNPTGAFRSLQLLIGRTPRMPFRRTGRAQSAGEISPSVQRNQNPARPCGLL